MDEYELEAEDQVEAIDPAALLQAIVQTDNVAELIADLQDGQTQLAGIADDCLRGFDIDKESMKDWFRRMERGVELAELVKEEKDYPFPNSANIKYPLITTAALQFNARAYPAIVPSDQIVKPKVHGKDQGGTKQARGDRVSEHMSWQLSSEIDEWEEVTDKMLTVLPIVGTLARKWWYDPAMGRSRCKMVDPGHFIVNEKVKSLDEAPRISEILPLFPDEIETRKRSGFFRDVDYLGDDGEDTHAQQTFIEQHCRIDLDEDGYEEPYIVTVHQESRIVARITADFDEEDISWEYEEIQVVDPMTGMVQAQKVPSRVLSIRRGTYYVAYHFLPSLTGGFHGTGLGLLLGDISETINSIINLMVDAGHMASRGGGFIGSEFRIKGGAHTFKPGEWKTVSARGADVKNALVPLTFPGADGTLFQMLGLLIDAGKEVASVKDILTGDTGTKNMTATTTLALIEQGMMVFTAAYKRIFRSLKREFKLLAKMNAQYIDPQVYAQFHDEQADVRADYNMSDMDIEPVADPSSVTRMQEAAKAQLVLQMAEAGLLDKNAAAGRVLEVSRIADVEELLPKPDPMQAQMGMVAMQVAMADAQLKKIEIDQAIADLEKTRSETVKNLSDAAAKEKAQRIDKMKMELEAIRDGLGAIVRGSAERMAAAPGFAPGMQGPAPINRPPNPAGNGSLLGGPGMAGSGPIGPASIGGGMGGLV